MHLLFRAKNYVPHRWEWLLFLSTVLMLAASAPASVLGGEEVWADPGDYRQAVRTLRAGDVLRLRPGVYRQGLTLHGMVGEDGDPIEIRGPLAGDPAVFVGRPGVNTVSIMDSAHVVIGNLVLDGQGLEVDGVKAEGHANWAHHITLENLVIRGHDASQQTVGISTKCPAWDWIIRGNTIVEAGTGIYLGDSDGSAPFVGGLIEYNSVRDTIGYNLQIKHQLARPEVAGFPREDRETVIRHNVFSKERGVSQTKHPRPNVLVGHFPPEGAGSDDRYLIYGNFFYENSTERLFQGEGNLALYDNIFINDRGDAVSIQPHKGELKRVWMFHNTVLASGGGILVTSSPGTEERRIVANAVFAAEPLRGSGGEPNHTGGRHDAGDYFRVPTGTLGDLDLRPKAGENTALHLRFTQLADAGCDYRGRPRGRQYAGALVPGGERPRLGLGRKPAVQCTSP